MNNTTYTKKQSQLFKANVNLFKIDIDINN